MGGFSGKRRTVKSKTQAEDMQAGTKRILLRRYGVDVGDAYLASLDEKQEVVPLGPDENGWQRFEPTDVVVLTLELRVKLCDGERF